MKRLLVILAHGGIGDVILATPVLKSLKEELSLDFLAMLVSSYTKEIIIGNPYIDEIIVDENPSCPSERAPFYYLLKKIKKYSFDGAIILWSTARFSWLIFLAGIPVRVGQDFRLMYSFLYTHKVKLKSVIGDKESHWVECLMDFPRQIGAGQGKPELYLSIRDEYKKKVDHVLESYGVSRDDLLIGLHPGRWEDISRYNWPYKNFAQIGDSLYNELGARLILTGSKKEQKLVDSIENNMKCPSINLAGKCNLMQLSAFIDRCNVFISTDSGPMHIAAARKIPTVAIFALKSDLPSRWGPYDNRHIIVRKDPVCSDKCIKETCQSFRCMHEVGVEDILEPVRLLLKEREKVSG